MDSERLGGLARTKLELLVRSQFPEITEAAESFNAGAAIFQDGRVFVYLTNPSVSPLAAALAWGQGRNAVDVHVIVDEVGPVLGRQALGFRPSPTIWQAVGVDLVAHHDTRQAASPATPAAVLAQGGLLTAAGCDAVVEHGVLIGEVLGLEVARVAVEENGEPVVRVGVGLYDQEAHALIHANASVEERLSQVVAEVRQHRRGDAPPHPLNRLARERWLRRVLIDSPGLVGLDTLESIEPLVARGGIHEDQAVAAVGTAGAAKTLVVTSTGIDLDMAPIAAGHLAAIEVAEVLLVLPERDHHDVVRRMATLLRVPATLRSVSDPWP